MKNIIHYLFLLIIIIACNDEYENDQSEYSNNQETEYKIEKLVGQVQKGPYNNGTTVSIYELTDSLAQTGRVFKSEINNNIGQFEISNITLKSPYVIVEANGFYFNECTGKNSEAQLTLSVIANIEDQTTLNINLLSHLEKDRVMKLVADSIAFNIAKQQAKNEILTVFNMSENNDTVTSEQLDITKYGDTNAKLLAISAIMQINNSTSDLSKLIADLKTDLYDNGNLDEDSIGNILLTQATLIKQNEIRQNLENKCGKENIDATIPNFERNIDQFIENSSYKVNSLISYPDSTYYGKNILHKDVDTVYYGEYYSLAANLNPEVSCKIVVTGKSFFTHIGLANPTNCIRTSDYGYSIFESLPNVEYISTRVHFESLDADEFGVSHYTIDYYEGTDELIKTDSKKLVAVQQNFTPYYTIPEDGIYGDNIWTMGNDTVRLQPDTKYSFEFETFKDFELQSLIRIRNVDTSTVIINNSDILNYNLERLDYEFMLSVNTSTTPQKYNASIIFKGHGQAEIVGHISIFNNAEKIRLKQIKQTIVW